MAAAAAAAALQRPFRWGYHQRATHRTNAQERDSDANHSLIGLPFTTKGLLWGGSLYTGGREGGKNKHSREGRWATPREITRHTQPKKPGPRGWAHEDSAAAGADGEG